MLFCYNIDRLGATSILLHNNVVQKYCPSRGRLRASTFSLRSHKDSFAFVTALPQRSDPKIRMKCYLFLRQLHRTREIFLKIILRACKLNLLM